MQSSHSGDSFHLCVLLLNRQSQLRSAAPVALVVVVHEEMQKISSVRKEDVSAPSTVLRKQRGQNHYLQFIVQLCLVTDTLKDVRIKLQCLDGRNSVAK